MFLNEKIKQGIIKLKRRVSKKAAIPAAADAPLPDKERKDREEYEIVEMEILPEKMICPDCGGITLVGLEFCDKCGGELINQDNL